MTNKACVHAINALLYLLYTINKPFSNKPFISIGDFRQVALIVRGGGLVATINASIRSLTLWLCFTLKKLE
jgi:hypothetical protein